jgi:hypothetical protein
VTSLIRLNIFVEDIEAITDNSDFCDVILVLDYFDLPKVRWKVDEESGFVLPLNVTTDLGSDLIGGLFGCDLDQVECLDTLVKRRSIVRARCFINSFT